MIAAGMLLATLAGCATDAPDSSVADEVARRLVPSLGNGLQVRRLQVTDDALKIDTTLAPYANPDDVDEEDIARLQRNGFLLFRIADILKPFPARRLETLHGAAGIMADDLVVAIYVNLLLQLLVWGFPEWLV